MKSISPEEFFKLIAANSGVMDIDTVRAIFYGMVKTISKELKNKHVVNLPDWGEFVLKVDPERKAYNVNKKTWETKPALAKVKFIPDYKVKKYFYALGKESTML